MHDNEIFRIRRGIGAYGKLWTGDRPEEGALVTYPKIVLRSCRHCGCTTNQFRASQIETATPEAFAKMPLREIWLFAGGVGSLPDLQPFSETLDVPSLLTNWSGRIGGIVLIAPEAVTSARVSGDEPLDAPFAPTGFAWTQVYAGETLRQWVMLPASGQIPDDREIEVVCPRGPAGDGSYTCPRCAATIAAIIARGERLDWWHSEPMPTDKLSVHVLGTTSYLSVDWRLNTWTDEAVLMYHGASTPGIAKTVLGYWSTPQKQQCDPGLRFLPDGAACIRSAYDADGTYIDKECFHSGWFCGGTHRVWHQWRRPGDDLVGFAADGRAWFAMSSGKGRTGYPVRVEEDGTMTWNCLTEFPDLVDVRRLSDWYISGDPIRVARRDRE
jgi:hypothetical protein